MEGLYTQLKDEGFSYSAFTRITSTHVRICNLLFNKLSQSELYILYHSFSIYFQDPQCRERPDYVAVRNAFLMLQREIERKIRSEIVRHSYSRGWIFCIVTSMLMFIANVVLYFTMFTHDDTFINTAVFCYFALQTFLYLKMASYTICLRRIFPLLRIHLIGSTSIIGRLCIWLYEWAWDAQHLRKCYYCRIFNMKQACKSEKLRPSQNTQEREQEESMRRRTRRAVLEEDDGVRQEEMRTNKEEMKGEKMKHMVRESNLQMTILNPADHSSINDSLVES